MVLIMSPMNIVQFQRVRAAFLDRAKRVSQPSLSTVRDDEVLVEVKKTGRLSSRSCPR